MSVAPFDWLEASYFYYRPSDLLWGEGVGKYLDKGFNIKLSRKSKYKYVPTIAIGLDDFAGTGLFTREYLVSTTELDNFKMSLGLGWGKYTGNHSFDNPLSFFSDSLNVRPITSDNFKLGGSLAFDKWFRGDSSLFGGLEYSPKKYKMLKLKIEYDPYDYFNFSYSENNKSYRSYDLRKKDSSINFGISYKYNNWLAFDASYIKGNTINLSFVISHTFGKNKKPKFNPKLTYDKNQINDKNEFYEELLNNINNNNWLLLQTANLNDNGKLDISIATANHRNAIRSSSYAAYIAKIVAQENEIDLSSINISHINAGIALNQISYIASHLDTSSKFDTPIELKKRYTTLDSGTPNNMEKNEFRPLIKFPTIFTSISPSFQTHVGRPSRFFYGGVNLNHFSEVQFSRNLILTSEIILPVADNFKTLESIPDSAMEHVRTEVVNYLKEDDVHINRMQLDYIWSPSKDFYSKISGGIFEQMFGGFGGQILYKPNDKKYSIAIDLFNVKQRSFNQRFNFIKYKTTTGHINFNYLFPAGIKANLSYGRYLAKDDGFTLDLSRTTKYGFKAGFYFTRTNVSAELFGEGSFDKGFYIQIPMDLFSSEYNGNYSSFKISPLTRDGGAKLIYDKDINGLIYNSTFEELNSQWDGFLN